MYFFECPAAAR